MVPHIVACIVALRTALLVLPAAGMALSGAPLPSSRQQPASSSPAPGAPRVAAPQHAETPPVRRAPAPFPADVSPRGPPPAPPPSSHKPSLSALSPGVGDAAAPPTPLGRSRTGPPLPSKPPGVTRSASQSSLGGGAKRPLRAPAVKPPPPPKSPAVVTSAASKFGTLGGPLHPGGRLAAPAALARRQSFGAPDSAREAEPPQPKPTGPPPPPRNVSVPSNLHQAHKVGTASYLIAGCCHKIPLKRNGLTICGSQFGSKHN